jgi:hypothetical protein
LSYPVKDSSRSFSYEKVVVVPVVVGALPKRALLLGHSPFKGAKRKGLCPNPQQQQQPPQQQLFATPPKNGYAATKHNHNFSNGDFYIYRLVNSVQV